MNSKNNPKFSSIIFLTLLAIVMGALLGFIALNLRVAENFILFTSILASCLIGYLLGKFNQ